jgi:hypothetical protein
VSEGASRDRFEFRVFAPPRRYRELRARLAAAFEERAGDRAEEVYLFAAAPGEPHRNVKLRAGCLSLKHLVRYREGLEQWHPETVEFPLHRTRGVQLARACPVPPVPGGGWDCAADLLRDAEKAPGICLAHVRKRRRRFTADGVAAEVVRLEVNGAELCSLALEGEEPGAVLEVRAALELVNCENVSYPRMLQYLSGLRALPPDAPGRVGV